MGWVGDGGGGIAGNFCLIAGNVGGVAGILGGLFFQFKVKLRMPIYMRLGVVTIFLLAILFCSCREASEPYTLVYFSADASSKGHISVWRRQGDDNANWFVDQGENKYSLHSNFEEMVARVDLRSERTNRGLKIYGEDFKLYFEFTPGPEVACFDQWNMKVACPLN